MQWQPIETAPKEDGSEFLVIDTVYGNDISVVRVEGGVMIGLCDGRRSIENQTDSSTDYHQPYATHWMPLPEPPKGEN